MFQGISGVAGRDLSGDPQADFGQGVGGIAGAEVVEGNDGGSGAGWQLREQTNERGQGGGLVVTGDAKVEETVGERCGKRADVEAETEGGCVG